MTTPKEVQELARHSTVDLTMNVYGRTREERMGGAIERMALKIAPVAPIKEDHALFMYGDELGAEPEIATPLHTESCDFFYLAPEVGLEPTTK
jgi:hypothetical protein